MSFRASEVSHASGAEQQCGAVQGCTCQSDPRNFRGSLGNFRGTSQKFGEGGIGKGVFAVKFATKFATISHTLPLMYEFSNEIPALLRKSGAQFATNLRKTPLENGPFSRFLREFPGTSGEILGSPGSYQKLWGSVTPSQRHAKIVC